MISKHILYLISLNESDLIYFTQLNGFTYFYLIVLFTINHLFAFKYFHVLPFNTHSLIKHQSFVYTQLNDQTVLFETIQFSICTQFLVYTQLNLKIVLNNSV